MKQVPVFKAFQFAFGMFRQNFLPIFLLCCAYGVMYAIRLSPSYFSPNTNWMNNIMFLVLFLPQEIITLLMMKIGLKGIEFPTQKHSFREIGFPEASVFWKFVLVSLLLGAYSLIGALILFVPFFFVITTYLFVNTIVLDSGKEIRISEVFHISERTTSGIKWKLLGYLLILFIPFIINLIISFRAPFQRILWKDAILVVIISFVQFPVQYLSTVFLYKSLKQQTEEN